MRRTRFVVLVAVPMLWSCSSPAGDTLADPYIGNDSDAGFEDATADAASDQDAAPPRDPEPPFLIGSSVTPRFAKSDATVIVRITANEPLAAAELEVDPAGPLFAVDAMPDDRSYAWRYRVDDDAREGAAHAVAVVLTDRAGNRERVALDERFVVDRIAPDVADWLIEPRRVQPGQSYTVSFETTELLGEAARVLVGDDEQECEGIVGMDTERYECLVVVADTEADGARPVMAELVDRAGNAQTVSMGEVEYRSVPPTSGEANEVDLSRTIYTRVPWGADGMVLPRSSLRGRLLPGATASEVVVANGPELASAYVIGRAPISSDGAFEVPALASEGATDIYVATSDEAGAVTAFRRVTEGEWVATLRGKRVASSTENPHRATHWPFRFKGLYGSQDDPEAVELGGRQLERRDYDPDAAPTAVRSVAQPRWRKRGHDAPAQAFAASVYDAARGKLMVFARNFQETWAWDGDTWTFDGQVCAPGIDCPAISGSPSLGYDAGRGRVVLFGGLNDIAGSPADEMNHTWEWDGTRWRRMASCEDPSACPSSRSSYGAPHEMIYHAGLRRLVQIGGAQTEAGGKDLWQWVGDGWTRLPTTCAAAGACPATVGRLGAYDAARDRIVVYEGADSATGRGLTSELDGTTWSRIESSIGPVGRLKIGYDAEHQRVRLFDQIEYSYAWDGAGWASSYASTCYEVLDEFIIGYDTARSRALAVQLGPDFIDSANRVRGTWERDGTTCTRVATAVGPNRRPRDRELHSMFYDGVLGSIRMLAGIAHDGTSGSWIEQNDVWRWDGFAWSEMEPCTAESGCPAAGNRSQHVMAYDAQRDRLVVFGGTSDVSDTWEWDGQTWTRFESCVAWDHTCPVARSGHALVYDAGDQRVVLFGGRDFDDRHLSDTWEWRGTQWARVTPIQCDDCPDERSSHAMAFDAERNRVVLFGGSDESAQDLADTWELDGNTWTRVAEGCASESSCPSARSGHTLAYDPARGRVVLFGGRSGEGAQAHMENDLWEWDGLVWTRVPITCAPDGRCPSARMFQTMAHDDARGQLVMFGGLQGFLPARQALGDTWELTTVSRPALVTRFDLTALAAPDRLASDALDPITLDEVRFVARAGAQADGGVAGAMLSAWNGLRWQSAACNSAPLDAPDELIWTTRDPKRIAGLQTEDDLHFELTPSADSGRGTIASLNTDYVEVRVRYHLGAGPGVIAPEPGTGGQGRACDPE